MRGLVLTLALASCTHAQAPKARLAGEVLAISGVVGLVAGALTSQYSGDHLADIMGTSSVVSALGITLFAVGDLTDPMRGPKPETEEQKYRRWAKILTGRAGGAAREGKCPRVRRLEKRVNLYNREIHDFVFMRDPEILKCLEAPSAPPDQAPERRPEPSPEPDPAAAEQP